MRIVIDLQAAQSPSRLRGIGRYALSLASSIIRHRREHEVLLVLNDLNPTTVEPLRDAFEGILPQDNIRVWQAAGPIRAHRREDVWRRSVAAELREAFIASLRPDVIHISSLLDGYDGDVVSTIGPLSAAAVTTVTLYDLIPLLKPETYFDRDPGYERYYREQIEHLRRADGWLAISDSSAREGCEVLGLSPDRVTNVSAASDRIFERMALGREEEGVLRRRFGLSKQFVMYSGGADGRKNLNRLIRAYARLSPKLRENHQLALVGSMSRAEFVTLNATARSAGLAASELVFTGFVDDPDLVRLYNLCRLFVLPSTHEGFGLPALEAMASGAAVIGSNTTSVPEVIGWEEALFDPLDEAAIAGKIAHALTDEAFHLELVRRGTERARAFSWDQTGERAVAALARVHERKPHANRPVAAGKSIDLDRLFDVISHASTVEANDQDLMHTSQAIARNHPLVGARQIFADVSQLVRIDANTGVQRVVRNILACLPEVVPPGWRVEPVYATPGRRGYQYAVGFPEDGWTPKRSEDPAIDISPRDVFLGLDLRQDLVAAQTGFYGELRRLGIPVFFVVYDLLPVLMPDKFPDGTREWHERWLATLAAQDGALCISRAVAHELARWMRASGPVRRRPYRIGWFHPGYDHKPAVPSTQAPALGARWTDQMRARPSFLVVGTLEPRKGHWQTLAAFDELWSGGADINLVFAGQWGWQMEKFVARVMSHPARDRRLFWLEGLSDEELAEVYEGSDCLLMVSEGEGFGLPIIEAAHHGTPILSRDLPVFREVAGNNAVYFSGLAPAVLAGAVRHWLDLFHRDSLPRSADVVRQTWRESASQVLNMLLHDDFQIRILPASVSSLHNEDGSA